MPDFPFHRLALAAALACGTISAHADTASTGNVMVAGSAVAGETCRSVNCFKKRWIYFGANMGRYKTTADPYYNKLVELIGVAKDAGYNGIAINSGGSGSYVSMLNDPPYYPYFYENYRSIIALAAAAGIELIPVAGQPENSIVRHPELIEALPVDKVSFKVEGSAASAVGTSIVANGGFENGSTGWNLIEAGKNMSLDSTVAHSGQTSVKFSTTQGAPGTSRLLGVFSNLRPHTAYRMSFWIKTENYGMPLTVQIYDPAGKTTIYRNYTAGLGWGTNSNGAWNADGNTLDLTQDWKQYNLDFNTANQTGFKLYFGTWATTMQNTGAAWIDDIDIREVGLPHVVRRDSLPVVVASASTGTVYTEGADYSLAGEKLAIPAASRIHDGDYLTVSSYQSGRGFSSGWSAPASACTQTFFDEQKAVFDKINALFNTPSKFFIYYDEWRVMNWDPSCNVKSAGEYLANTTRKMQDTLLSVNPALDMYIWNDMYDPNLNAVPLYYTVNGDLSNSVQGLNPNTVVMNWTGSKAKQVPSLQFFAGKQFHQMLALYYDDKTLGATRDWLQNLSLAEQSSTLPVSGVDGFMYTTWYGTENYGDLKNVTDLIKREFPQYWPTPAPAAPAQ